MKIQRLAKAISSVTCIAVFAGTVSVIADPVGTESQSFDFGPTHAPKGYQQVDVNTDFTTAAGYGWTASGSILLQRSRFDRDPIMGDFMMSDAPATFRVMLSTGDYRAQVVMGDAEFGSHSLMISDGSDKSLPVLTAKTGEYATLTWPVRATSTNGDSKIPLDIQFSTPDKTWVVNSLSFTQTDIPATPSISRKQVSTEHPRPFNKKSNWQDVTSYPDTIEPLLRQFLHDQKSASIKPTGLNRLDYIKLAADNVDFWKQHQNSDGAIIDPYRKEEWQYSTPCFALAGAAAIQYLHRDDLIDPVAKAMDWACLTLSEGRAANHHEDFFAPVLAHALPLLKPHVPPARSALWEKEIAAFNPYDVYRATPGHGNWNVVASSGEYLFYKLGLRKNNDFVEDSLAGQGNSFRSPLGLYLEGPMAYDHFPRLWAADMMAHGYNGKYEAPLAEMLRRAAITSMFMQSPMGELPLGHRSAHHQWNEAEQCVTYEIYCAAAKRNHQPNLAAAFKRAAHLALASIKRWQRPSGELWIVKNKVNPAEFHGFESYSAHSQYNLLPMAMLVMAHENSADTEGLAEMPAPADVGGFVLHVDGLHKVFANASGAYVEIETNADLHYDATGLVRVHFKGENPQLGPSDILTSTSNYTLPDVPRVTAAIGPTWKGSDGQWKSLAEMGGNEIRNIEVEDVETSPGLVRFTVSYHGYFDGPQYIKQSFDIHPRRVGVATELVGYRGRSRLEWPVLSNNGKDKTNITIDKKTISVALDDSSETFSAPDAESVGLSEREYPNRNGWAKLARADFGEHGGAMSLGISPDDQ